MGLGMGLLKNKRISFFRPAAVKSHMCTRCYEPESIIKGGPHQPRLTQQS